MSERVVHPKTSPDKAAQEVVLALCETGAFDLGGEYKAMSTGDGEALADAIIAVHQKLTAYYKQL